jgi:ABC-2 type transport system permease protein
MKLAAVVALVRNDLRVHFADRRGVVINIAAAAFIAGFMGFLFGGSGKTQEVGRIPVAIAVEDETEVSEAIARTIAGDKMIDARRVGAAEARDLVRKGKAQAGFVLPKGFADAAGAAFFRGKYTPDARPEIELFYDPSQSLIVGVIDGLLAQAVMQEVSRAIFSGPLGRKAVQSGLDALDRATDANVPNREDVRAVLRSVGKLTAGQGAPGANEGMNVGSGFGLSVPYTVHSEALTSGTGVRYNGYAHSFAGMSVQFILFTGIESGVLLLLLRERGLWARLRSAPLKSTELLTARALSTTIVGLFMLCAIYLIGALAFGVRVEGSVAGFVGIAIGFCLFNACFGLLLAAIGRTPAATRGLAVMAVLLLVMLGGAWVPSFLFPAWLQQASLFLPTRWAVDGLDAVTWRGLGFDAAAAPIAVLIGWSALCAAVALWRFRWQA